MRWPEEHDVDVLIKELRHLRKRPNDIHACPVLLRTLGGGEPSIAYKGLMDVARCMRDSVDVRVAIETMARAGSVLDRLNSVEHIVGDIDQRNVRPKSDRGIEKLAVWIATVDENKYPSVMVSLGNRKPGVIGFFARFSDLYTDDPEVAVTLRVNDHPVPFEIKSRDIGGVAIRQIGLMKFEFDEREPWSLTFDWDFYLRAIVTVDVSTVNENKKWRCVQTYNRLEATLMDRPVRASKVPS